MHYKINANGSINTEKVIAGGEKNNSQRRLQTSVYEVSKCTISEFLSNGSMDRKLLPSSRGVAQSERGTSLMASSSRDRTAQRQLSKSYKARRQIYFNLASNINYQIERSSVIRRLNMKDNELKKQKLVKIGQRQMKYEYE